MGDSDGADENSSSDSAWRVLIDENSSPSIVAELTCHDIRAEYVLDVLFEGADDFEDILPYCRKRNAVLVTNNVRDFNAADLSPSDHAGIVIVHDKDRPAAEIALNRRRLVAAYPGPDSLRGFESAADWQTD